MTFATASDFDGKFIFDWVKKILPDTISILTGSHATNYPGRAVEQGTCDYSLKGEIDFTLPKLINNLKNNLEIENIDGLSFTINKKIFNNTNYPKVDIKNCHCLPITYWMKNMLKVTKKLLRGKN